MAYNDDLLLGYLSMELLYSVNDSEFILKNYETNKTLKIDKTKYQSLLKDGYIVHKSIDEGKLTKIFLND